MTVKRRGGGCKRKRRRSPTSKREGNVQSEGKGSSDKHGKEVVAMMGGGG